MAEGNSEKLNFPEVPYPYQLLELVGSGGLGRVFKAKNLHSGDIVAIKFLHDEMFKKPEILGSFHKELLILSQMKHKNIVSYREAKWNPPHCFMVTDFIEGWNGHTLLKKVGKFPPLIAISITLQVLQAVDHLHVHDIIHSDLTPGNILIDKEGRVYLTDFGLSMVSEVDSSEGKKFGTPGYFSPEHINRKKLVEGSDLYAAGLLLYQFIAGVRFLPASKNRHDVVPVMRKRNLSLIHTQSSRFQAYLIKILKNSLSYFQFFRYSDVEPMIYDLSSLLYKSGINYPRHAVWQYLSDLGVSEREFKGKKQNIYAISSVVQEDKK